MRKSFLCALVLAGAFLFTPAASAQFTTVTATVKDPNGIPYAGAVMNAILVPSTGGGYTLSGNPYSGRIGPVTLDSTGKFTVNFGDVTLISPGSPQWQITIDSAAATIQGPLGTGPQSFTYTSTGTTISGSSPVSLTTAMNALAPALTNITIGSGTVTSVAATSPIVVTPSPIVGTGTISCPTCNTSGLGGTISASHLTYASGANTVADVAGSAVTGGTGAIALTAGADTTTDLTLNSHSATQSATTLDVSNQSTGGAGTGTLAAGAALFEGRGLGAFNPGSSSTVVAIQQESSATANDALIITNKQALSSSSRTSTLQMFVPDNGIGTISGGNAVGDGSGNYDFIYFDDNPSKYGAASLPGGLGISLIENPTTTAQVPLTVGNLNVSTVADMVDIVNSTTILSGFDVAGNLFFQTPSTLGVPQWINVVTNKGAKHDAHKVVVSTTSGGTTGTLTSGNCSASDVGKPAFFIAGVPQGSGNGVNAASGVTIATCAPGTSFTIAGSTFSGNFTGTTGWIGTNDAVAINNCLSAAASASGVCYMPGGTTCYLFNAQISISSSSPFKWMGDSMDDTCMVFPPFSLTSLPLNVNDTKATAQDISVDDGAKAVLSCGNYGWQLNSYASRLRFNNWNCNGGGSFACFFTATDGVQNTELESSGCYDGYTVASTGVSMFRPNLTGSHSGLHNFDASTHVYGGTLSSTAGNGLFADNQGGFGTIWLYGTSIVAASSQAAVSVVSGATVWLNGGIINGTKGCAAASNSTGINIASGGFANVANMQLCSNGTGFIYNNSGTLNISAGNTYPAIGAGTYTGTGTLLVNPLAVGSDTQLAKAAAQTAKTLFTVGGQTTFFRVHLSVECTTTSAAATVTPAVLYTDTSGTVQTVTGTAATCTSLGASSNTSQDVTFRAQNATNIQYQTTIANTPTYDISVTVEQLGLN